MTFDFGGAPLDPVRDREALGWMMNQFLYGEITGRRRLTDTYLADPALKLPS
jgi:hypothetical protein